MTLEYLKGTSVGLRPAVKHLWPFLGQCNKLAIDSLNQSSMHSSILLPEMTAANFKAWCTYTDLEAAFLNKNKCPPGVGQVPTNTHQAQTFKWTWWLPATAFFCSCGKQNKFRNFFTQASIYDLFLVIFPVASPPNFNRESWFSRPMVNHGS